MENKKVINVDALFKLKKEKKADKTPTVSSIKKALLQKIAEKQAIPTPVQESIKELTSVTNNLPPAPSFSSLKGGSRPTFRQLNKTLRAPVVPVSNKKIEKHYAGFGKQTLKRKISVFLKNNSDKTNVAEEIKTIDNQDLATIKDYLIKRDLIKIGTAAPESIIREIYKNSLLAGDVHNVNPNNLFHNFLNSSK